MGAKALKRPVLRYHGGKWKLAPWLISLFPPHRVYVEPYGGGGSVLMRKAKSYAEVYNDKWETVVNVFRVLRDPDKAAELRRLLEMTPYARDEFELTSYPLDAGMPDTERARRTIFRSFAGFGSAAVNGNYATGFRANSNRSGTTPAHDWKNYPQHIESFVERLRGVVVENRDACDVIRQHDSDETLFYVDPPYVHSTRNMKRGNAAYHEEMSEDDHRELSGALRAVKGMIVLSGYASYLYDKELYPDWTRVERPAKADGAKDRTEVVWMNHQCAEKQQRLFA